MEFPVNEKKEIRRNFKKCFSLIDQEDYNSQKFLREKRGDNILLIRKFGETYRVDCFRRSEIQQYVKYNKQYCKPSGSMENKENYIHLNIGGVECYFNKNDIAFILNSHHQIYYAEPANIKLECYNSTQDLYHIKVCGGKSCLPKIFGPKEREEKEENVFLNQREPVPSPVIGLGRAAFDWGAAFDEYMRSMPPSDDEDEGQIVDQELNDRMMRLRSMPSLSDDEDEGQIVDQELNDRMMRLRSMPPIDTGETVEEVFNELVRMTVYMMSIRDENEQIYGDVYDEYESYFLSLPNEILRGVILARDSDGMSLLDKARSSGNDDIVNFLLPYFSDVEQE